MTSFKSHFLLRSDVVYLNHGAFGACARPVFEVYQSWQREFERQPVEFLGRRASTLMAEARARLAAYLHCEADEVVYFPNPTTAINMVARSLGIGPGDEVLASDHEYGAMDRTWRFVCQQIEARYVRQPIPLPLTDAAEFVEHVWRGMRPQTRAIFPSHITSPTALRGRVEIICSRARAAGILTWVRSASCTPPISMVPKPSSVSSSAPGCSTKPIS